MAIVSVGLQQLNLCVCVCMCVCHYSRTTFSLLFKTLKKKEMMQRNLYLPIHPSIHLSLVWDWVAVTVVRPEISHPSTALQLLLRDPEELHGQMGFLCPGYTPGPLSSLTGKRTRKRGVLKSSWSNVLGTTVPLDTEQFNRSIPGAPEDFRASEPSLELSTATVRRVSFQELNLSQLQIYRSTPRRHSVLNIIQTVILMS